MSKSILKDGQRTCDLVNKEHDKVRKNNIPDVKEYTFLISETWAIKRTFVAESEDEAYDIANEYQNNFDMDLGEAKFIEHHISLKGD